MASGEGPGAYLDHRSIVIPADVVRYSDYSHWDDPS